MVGRVGLAYSLRESATLLRRLSRANSYKRAAGTFALRNSTSSVRVPHGALWKSSKKKKNSQLGVDASWWAVWDSNPRP